MNHGDLWITNAHVPIWLVGVHLFLSNLFINNIYLKIIILRQRAKGERHGLPRQGGAFDNRFKTL